MARTYKWSDFVTAASALLKGVGQFASQAVQYCDAVSSDMYLEYPWKETITTTSTAPGLTPLLNGIQDYSPSAPNIFRLLNAAIWNTTSVPATVQNLNVVDQLAVNLFQQSYTTIRDISLQHRIAGSMTSMRRWRLRAWYTGATSFPMIRGQGMSRQIRRDE